MIRLVPLASALLLASGCATHEARYQVGSQGSQQSKAEAEQTHAAQTAIAGSGASSETPPKVLTSRFPDYPASWQAAGIVGTVVVSFNIEPDGSVSDPSIQGSPPSELAAITLNAIMRWKFTPATKGGTPIRVRARQQFVFKVE